MYVQAVPETLQRGHTARQATPREGAAGRCGSGGGRSKVISSLSDLNKNVSVLKSTESSIVDVYSVNEAAERTNLRKSRKLV